MSMVRGDFETDITQAQREAHVGRNYLDGV